GRFVEEESADHRARVLFAQAVAVPQLPRLAPLAHLGEAEEALADPDGDEAVPLRPRLARQHQQAAIVGRQHAVAARRAEADLVLGGEARAAYAAPESPPEPDERLAHRLAV